MKLQVFWSCFFFCSLETRRFPSALLRPQTVTTCSQASDNLAVPKRLAGAATVGAVSNLSVSRSLCSLPFGTISFGLAWPPSESQSQLQLRFQFREASRKSSQAPHRVECRCRCRCRCRSRHWASLNIPLDGDNNFAPMALTFCTYLYQERPAN